MHRAPAAPRPLDRRSGARRSMAWITGVVVGALVLAACGGDDDDDGDADASTTTTEASVTVAPVSTASTTTAPPTTTTTTLPPVEYVTEGATVVVANASGIDGAAGRMTNQLEAVGFATGTATNSTESQLETSKIYYAADDEAARAVADSLREGFGGGDIEVVELPTPAPTESGEIGDATVLVAMGNDIADRSLDDLQGRLPTDDGDEGTDDTGDEDTADTGDDTADEDTADDDTADEDTADEGTADTGDG